MLLSLSYIVVPKKELAIILFSFVTNLQSNPKEPSIALLINIEIDTPRDWSAYTIMGRFGHEQYLFYFILFSDFIGILFSFSFSFLLDDEEARDTVVT